MLDPQLKGFIQRVQSLPKARSLADERRQWRQFCLGYNRPPPAGIRILNHSLSLTGREIPLRWYRPKARAPQACLIYLHGGGWVLGDLDTQDTIAWSLADSVGAAVLSVDYRLAPEHPYPAAFDDSYAVLQWLSDNSENLDIDPRRIAVCGDSAGGNLSAAVSLAARDRNGPAIAAQVLFYPVLDADTSRPSYVENADLPMLSREEMAFYLSAYLGPGATGPDAYAMPMRAENLERLPPAWVHTAEFDPLHDEGLAYFKRLRDAGNHATYRCALALPHSFLRARFECDAAASELEAAAGFLRRELGLSVE